MEKHTKNRKICLSIAKFFSISRIGHMASLIDLRRQIDTLDRQVVELLGRRTALVKQIIGKSEEEITDQDRERQVLSNWLEEGFEYDLDEGTLERICKAVMELAKRSKDR